MNQRKREILEQASHNEQENRASYQYDLNRIQLMTAIASKISKKEEVSEEEKETLEEFKNEYNSFFESEDESGDESGDEKKQNLEDRVIEAGNFLATEVRVANRKIDLIQRELEKPNSSEVSNEGSLGEVAGGSLGEVARGSLGELPETSRKRRAVSSEDEVEEPSSKKPRETSESPSDFIDSLPSDYNPLDDIGSD